MIQFWAVVIAGFVLYRLNEKLSAVERLVDQLQGTIERLSREVPERQATPAASDLLPTWIFWGVLAAAVVILLLLITRLVRQSDAAAPATVAPGE